MPTPQTSFEPTLSLASQALTSFEGAASRAEQARILKDRAKQVQEITCDPEVRATCKLIFDVLDLQEKHHMDAGNLMQMLIRHLEAEQNRIQKINNRLKRMEKLLQPVERILSWFSGAGS